MYVYSAELAKILY